MKNKVPVPGWGKFVVLPGFLPFCDEVQAQMSQKEGEP
jgi:hypothetical protein